MVSGKKNSRKNGPQEKWSPQNRSPEKWFPENSEVKNHGLSVEYRDVCVCRMFECDQSMKTRNLSSVEHCGVCVEFSNVINLWKPKTRKRKVLMWASSIVVCVCVCGMPNVINLWKLKTWQQTFRTPSVFYSLVHVGSWGERQTSFCVCSGINQ